MRKIPRQISDRLPAAADLFAEKGLNDSKIEDVAAVTGVPKATLYYYFAGKEDILAFLLEDLLKDIEEDTVDFAPNYDGSEKEPTVLPARLPNLLINGSAGIAVGMATNIPPHNLNEVVDACLHLLRNPEASIDELMEIIPAPDFPTAGIIYSINNTIAINKPFKHTKNSNIC